MERLKRPSSLSKALIPSSPSTNVSTTDRKHNVHLHLGESASQSARYKEYAQDYQEPIDTKKIMNTAPDIGSTCQIEDEFIRKKNGLDNRHSYSIVKELIMTERTYKKNLDLLTLIFRQFLATRGFNLSEIPQLEKLIYIESLDLINEFHCRFLKNLEFRLYQWSDKSNVRNDLNLKIGDLLYDLSNILGNYKNYVNVYTDILNEIELACKMNRKFEHLFKEFESQKICYLPFTMFLIKPLQRLIHYKFLLKKLVDYYGPRHHDYQATFEIFIKLLEINQIIDEKLQDIENKQKMMDLQKDLIGVENLASHTNPKLFRRFVREGSLQKLSRKGYQQRMFFLFDDIFLYCARSSTPLLQFKVHGEFNLRKIQVEDGNAHINIPNSFTIYSSNRSLLVAAVSQEEKKKWLQDLNEAINHAKRMSNEDRQNYSTMKSNSSSDNNLDSTGVELDENVNHSNQKESSDLIGNEKTYLSMTSDPQNRTTIQPHRANTTIQVCWHRNTSVSFNDNHHSLVNQLSGYLLRKFKNSNGWQKLWVVFSNFCLFFYKTYQDEFPLASLPLLGYIITQPNQSDNITKDYVFKLKFKNHVYFFRAENQYSFDRWLEVMECAAQKQCTFINEE